jgi:hypothetical protein
LFVKESESEKLRLYSDFILIFGVLGSSNSLPIKSSKGREAGTGIEPVNSGFADRGLTTWLPRRIRLPDLIRWLFAGFLFCFLLPIFQNQVQVSDFRPTIARGPVQQKQGVQVLPGWLESQWEYRLEAYATTYTCKPGPCH